MLLNFEKTREMLVDYELPLSDSESVSSFEKALEFVEENGYPVVLKVSAPQLLHRTEKNLVRTKIQNEQQLKDSFQELESRAEEIESSRIIIQNQEEGLQLIYGMKKDETFGPVLMFGLGGIFVEVLEDVSFGITPVDRREAQVMIRSIKSFKALKGFRNYPAVDLDEAADLLIKLSDLVEHEKVEGVDFNPVFAKGEEIKIADPKLIV